MKNKFMAKITTSIDGSKMKCENCGMTEFFKVKSGVKEAHADFKRRHRSCKLKKN